MNSNHFPAWLGTTLVAVLVAISFLASPVTAVEAEFSPEASGSFSSFNAILSDYSFPFSVEAPVPVTPFDNDVSFSYSLDKPASVTVRVEKLAYDRRAFNFLDNYPAFQAGGYDYLPSEEDAVEESLSLLLDQTPYFDLDFSNIKHRDGASSGRGIIYELKSAPATAHLSFPGFFWNGVASDGFLQNGEYAITGVAVFDGAQKEVERRLVVAGSSGTGQYLVNAGDEFFIGGNNFSIKEASEAGKLLVYDGGGHLAFPDFALGEVKRLQGTGIFLVTETGHGFVVTFSSELSAATATKQANLRDHDACSYSFSTEVLATLANAEAAKMCSPTSPFCWGSGGTFCFSACSPPGYKAADALACCRISSPHDSWPVSDKYRKDLVFTKQGYCDCPDGFKASGIGCAASGTTPKLEENETGQKTVEKAFPAGNIVTDFSIRTKEDRFSIGYRLTRPATITISAFDSAGKRVVNEVQSFTSAADSLANPHTYWSALGYGNFTFKLQAVSQGKTEEITQKLVIPAAKAEKKVVLEKKREAKAVASKPKVVTPPATAKPTTVTPRPKVSTPKSAAGSATVAPKPKVVTPKSAAGSATIAPIPKTVVPKPKAVTQPPIAVAPKTATVPKPSTAKPAVVKNAVPPVKVSGRSFEGSLAAGAGVDFGGAKVFLQSVSGNKYAFVVSGQGSRQCTVTRPGAVLCSGIEITVTAKGKVRLYRG